MGSGWVKKKKLRFNKLIVIIFIGLFFYYTDRFFNAFETVGVEPSDVFITSVYAVIGVELINLVRLEIDKRKNPEEREEVEDE